MPEFVPLTNLTVQSKKRSIIKIYCMPTGPAQAFQRPKTKSSNEAFMLSFK